MTDLFIPHPSPHEVIPEQDLIPIARRIYAHLNRLIYDNLLPESGFCLFGQKLSPYTLMFSQGGANVLRGVMADRELERLTFPPIPQPIEPETFRQLAYQEAQKWTNEPPEPDSRMELLMGINKDTPWNLYNMTHTIAHEMIHHYIRYFGIPDTHSHGKVFKQIMNYQNQHFGLHIGVRSDSTDPCFAVQPSTEEPLPFRMMMLLVASKRGYMATSYSKSFMLKNLLLLQETIRSSPIYYVLNTIRRNPKYYLVESRHPQFAKLPQTLMSEAPVFYPVDPHVARQALLNKAHSRVLGAFDQKGYYNISDVKKS